MDKFESKVDALIVKLKNYKSKNSKSKGKIFNPWSDTNADDISIEAPEIRCENLKKYLLEHKNAKYIMLAESPSHGCHYTGIAMTSEWVINNYPELFSKYKTTSVTGNVREGTAKQVWKVISGKEKNFVLWNAFVFQTYKDNFSPRKPSDDELKEGLEILLDFLELYADRKRIIAVGRTAEKILKENKIIAYDDNDSYVRHPSCGGVPAFQEKMYDILHNIK